MQRRRCFDNRFQGALARYNLPLAVKDVFGAKRRRLADRWYQVVVTGLFTAAGIEPDPVSSALVFSPWVERQRTILASQNLREARFRYMSCLEQLCRKIGFVLTRVSAGGAVRGVAAEALR